MNRILAAAVSLALFAAPAHAAGGFSCESGEGDPVKVLIEGATPRSEPGLINFGGVIEFDGTKIELKKSDVKGFTGKNGIIRVRASARAGDHRYTVRLNVRRNPKDEDDWPGTYEITHNPAGSKKAQPADTKRGKVKCFVE